MLHSKGLDGILRELSSSLEAYFIPFLLARATYYLQCVGHRFAIVFYFRDADTLQNAMLAESNQTAHIVYIYEDDWRNKQAIIIGRLMAYVGKAVRIHARACSVVRLDKQCTIDFLRENHLQVPLAGKYRYGLTYKEQLVAIAVFSGARRMHKEHGSQHRSFELIRNCNKNGSLVVGGLSKLIKHFVKDFRPNDVMTYVDRDWSDGSAFAKLGFVLAGVTEPHGFWVDGRTWVRTEQNRIDKDRFDRENFYCLRNRGSLKMIYHID
ncbi:hypothetical protein [Olivibacter sitiensis]|uniref:hypothetical protein n=1 Tax=Olivibacter sitiensis TaxID=376470 RepID=UPI0012FAB7FE|nr:hypothetical protein [Olivibacter sitiensis]